MDLPLGHYVNGCEWRKTLDFTLGIPFYITMYSRYIKRTKLLAILLGYILGTITLRKSGFISIWVTCKR
jgi:heme O synthase-like polyprenyltransferase